MTAPNNGEPASLADVLVSMRQHGVRLWLEDGHLRYEAPKGSLTQEAMDRLRASRTDIVALLKRTELQSASAPTASFPRLTAAPLTYSQLAHWHLYRLHERLSVRHIASATRVRGRLDLDALKNSISAVMHRHDALRTRINIREGVPTQRILVSEECELKFEDLTNVPRGACEREVVQRLEEHILEPVDLIKGPLFAIRLLKLGDDEHVLIFGLEHMIADAYSRGILLRDLFTAYKQRLGCKDAILPPVAIQFSDYAAWQSETGRIWLAEHGAYWSEHLRGCGRVRFPEDRHAASGIGWATVPVQIGWRLKQELCEWARLRRTTLVMTVLTAYVALVLRWCKVSEVVIRYLTDGRSNPAFANVIGYFASSLYLRLQIDSESTFVDLISEITKEYCAAYEHADSSYLEAQVPRPEFAHNSAFNWVPQATATDSYLSNSADEAIACTPIRFAHPIVEHLDWDFEPMIVLFDTEDGIEGGVHFPRSRFSIEFMERFSRNFLAFIQALIERPEGRVRDVDWV